jgi:hypothetical protein
MGKGGDDACWADVNLTGPKNEENSRGQSSCYKWMVKIESNDGEFNFFLKHTQVRSSFAHLIA